MQTLPSRPLAQIIPDEHDAACRKVESLLVDYLLHNTSAEEEQLVESHLEHCECCFEILCKTRTVIDSLGTE